MERVKVKLFQDGKIHEYNEDIAERLEASGRCKILGVVGGLKAKPKPKPRSPRPASATAESEE